MKEKKEKGKIKMKASTMYYITAAIWMICALMYYIGDSDDRMFGVVYLSLGVVWISSAATFAAREKKQAINNDYYEQNAERFVEETFNADMSESRSHFTALLPAGATVLDWGCGSGRDALAFKEAGFQVEATDASETLCKLATEKTGIEVRNESFEELKKKDCYDGIWACASLLHIDKSAFNEVLRNAHTALKKGGVLYMSFKYGDFEGERDGRFFSDRNEKVMEQSLKYFRKFELVEQWVSQDVREGKEDQQWFNVIVKKK